MNSRVKIKPLKTDAYVFSHPFLEPEVGIEDFRVAHMYNRAKPMFLYGFSRLVKEVLSHKYTMLEIAQAEERVVKAGEPFDFKLWERVVKECNGYLPIQVQSLPDGSYCPKGTPFAQIKNTVAGFGHFVEFVEAQLMKGYFASACATEAYEIMQYLKSVGLPANQVHSFGFRGHRSDQDAEICTEAMSLFMPGSDDFHGLELAPRANLKSIPALSHFVVQQWEDEYQCYIHAIEWAATTENKIIAIVIDTYDANRFISQYLIKLAQYAIDCNVRIVFRPDSGETVNQMIIIYHALKVNGMEEAHNVIIGEGVSLYKIKETHARMKKENIPLSFCFFGIGGGFYNHIERDTLGWAMKLAFSGGQGRMKFSNNPLKRSIPGEVKLSLVDDGVLTVFDFNEPGIRSTEYETIAVFNPEKMKRPKFKVQSWNKAKFLVENYLFNNNQPAYGQKEIVLSAKIQENIKAIEAKRFGK